MEKGEKNTKKSPVNGQPVPVNPNGRPKGVPNKATTRFKEALNQLFECNADKMIGWLDEVRDPKDRFDILSKFIEILYPKLARTDVSIDGSIQQNVTVDLSVIAEQFTSLPSQDAQREAMRQAREVINRESTDGA